MQYEDDRPILHSHTLDRLHPLMHVTKHHESASSPLVGFGLNDNMIKGLTNLLSVGQEVGYLTGTW